MKRYRARAIASASKFLGEIEAENEEAAEEAAFNHPECHMSLCHYCAGIDLCDVEKIELEEITDEE